jgi:multidrug resistance efflux pump
MGRDLKRILLGLLIIAVPAAFVFLGVSGFVVRNAVVTAHLEIVESPIAGEVIHSELELARATTEATTVVTLRDPRSDPHRMDTLISEIERTLRSIEANQETLRWYDDAIAGLEQQFDALLDAMKLDQHLAYQVVQAKIIAQEALNVFLTGDAERTRRLQGTAASEARLQEADADLKAGEAQLLSLQAEAERSRQRLEFLDTSLLVLEDADDAIAVAAAIRELSTERHHVNREEVDLESGLAALREQLASAQQSFAAASEANAVLPANSVVWEVFVNGGATVTVGEPLFSFASCEHRLVQATVDDSTIELIQPDHRVTVYLYGDTQPMEGHVHSIYGSGAHQTRGRSLAANIEAVGGTDAIVLIDIGPAEETARHHRLCDIGRSAYVEFEGIGFLDPFLNRIF